MKQSVTYCLIFVCSLLADAIYAQQPWLTAFEEREELNHILKLSNGNFLLSGKTFELGNKSDIVILTDRNGVEIKRKTICPPCSFGNIVYSKESADNDNEIIHVRSSGDIFVSSNDLEGGRFIFNVKFQEFEFVETYQVLENANFLVIVSYAVKDGIRGLLHTTVNTLTEKLVSNKFNTLFPDISGSIGIGLFNDVGVVDGYNSLENEVSTGHLLRFDIQRNLVWSLDLDWGNIDLEHVLVSWDQNIYAVGTIEDENNEGHWQGFLVSYDKEGELLWEKRFDSPNLDESGVVDPARTISKIKQIKREEFVLMGKDGGKKSGKEFGNAFILRIDGAGEIVEEFSTSAITEDVQAVDVVLTPGNELMFLAQAFAPNGIAGSFITIARNVSSSSYVPLPNDISIFPNPASEYLIINDEHNGQDLEIRMFNNIGHQVLSQNGTNRLSIEHIESGTYFLQIVKDAKLYYHVFIKQ